ncbi:MAG: two-component regulator propeller domain-containing protein [Saprospiraceae bacterium]
MKFPILKYQLKILLIGLMGIFFFKKGNTQSYINFKSWDATAGLPAKLVCIEQEESGIMWLATLEGLYKFDGSTFYLVDYPLEGSGTLPLTYFTSLHLDSDGILWAGSMEMGLFAIDTRAEKAQQFTFSGTDQSSISDNRVNRVYEDPKGRLWVSFHKEGFCLFDKKEGKCLRKIMPGKMLGEKSGNRNLDDVISLYYKEPYLYGGTLKGLLRYQPEGDHLDWVPIHTPETLTNPELIDGYETSVRFITEAGKDHLWLGTWGGGLIRYSTKNQKGDLIKFTKDPKTDLAIHAMVKRDSFSYWIATDKGFGIFEKNKKNIRFLNQNDFRANTEIILPRTLFVDRQDRLWITEREIFHVILPERNSFPAVALPFQPAEVYQIPGTKKHIGSAFLLKDYFVTNENGQKTFKTYQAVKEKPINYLQDFYADKNGRLFCSDNTDIFIWDEKSQEVVPFHKIQFPGGRQGADKSLLYTLLDSKGNIWCGTKADGLARVNTTTHEEEFFTSNHPDPNKRIAYDGFVNSVFEDSKGRVWYGTEKGFGYFDPNKETFVNFPFPSYTTDHPEMPFKHIFGINEDKQGRIWLGSNRKGVGYLEILENGKGHIHCFSSKDGIRSDGVDQMISDEQGNIWISTDAGLTRILLPEIKFENYGSEYGIAPYPVVKLTEEGKLLVTSNHVYYIIDPEKISPIDQTPQAHIWSFSVFDKKQDWKKDKIQMLDYSQNYFSFDFGALDYHNPGNSEFAYQLEGLEEQWNYTRNRNFASYTNVSGGDYTFKVKARIEGGVWGPEASVPIFISTPFWKTGWFYLTMLVLVLTLVYLFYKNRIRQIEEKAALESEFSKKLAEVEMTALRAQMNPHFLFNCLNSIKLFIVKNDTKAAADYLTKFSKLIRLILQNSKNHLVPLSDDLEALDLYIEMEKMRFGNRFKYELKIDEGLNPEHYHIPPLLLQPYVENAIWHGLVHEDKENQLTISIRNNHKNLTIEIEDNGIGREAARERKKHQNARKQSLGMAITSDRVSLTKELYQIEMSVEVEDLYNKNKAIGTRVRINLPEKIIRDKTSEKIQTGIQANLQS